MISLNGSGNVSWTPLLTSAVPAGWYRLGLRVTGSAYVETQVESVDSVGAGPPNGAIADQFVSPGDEITYRVINSTGAWSFDFTLHPQLDIAQD